MQRHTVTTLLLNFSLLLLNFLRDFHRPRMEGEKTKDHLIKEKLIAKGLHVDWLVRAHQVSTLETLVYLADQRQKWANEDQRIVLSILQDYENSGGDLISEHEPAQFKKIRRVSMPPDFAAESPEVYVFTCQLIQMVKEEPAVWDKHNSEDFGYHQILRQSWCSISLKLGGWGTMQHVHMLKQLYRRKRDLYNEHLRHGKPYAYSEQLSFLKNYLEMAKTVTSNRNIYLKDHIEAAAPDIDYETEILAAPSNVQNILKEVSDAIDAVAQHSPEILSTYLSICCNNIARHREYLATESLKEDVFINAEDFTSE